MTAIDPWLYPITAVLLAGIGGVLLVRGLFGRWFPAGGKAGRVRSCRKCRFDLSTTEGHTCPECGHTARHEAEHYAGRVRWPVAALGLLLLLGAVGVGMTPGIQRDGWLHLLPMGVQVRVFHLETNPNSFWMFSEHLEGRQPTGGPGGFAISIHNENISPEVRVWRDTACRVAAGIVSGTRPRPAPQTDRAWTLLNRHGRAHLAEEMHDALFPSPPP
jgi:hypothetical protein